MEKEYIKICKEKIERQLGGAPGSEWKQRDFEYLSELIFKKTKTLLSISTLKRIWSPEAKTLPHLSTLNALAQYCGYIDWHDFKKIHSNGHSEKESEKSDIETLPNTLSIWNTFTPKFVIAFLIIFVIALLVPVLWNSNDDNSYDKVIFKSKKVVTAGVPNTVVFDYDVSGINSDSIFIQQSWDARMRAKVSREGKQFTSIYYYPGFHEAKLIVDGEIIKRHFIHVTTDGWMALVRYTMDQPVPIYLPKNGIFDKRTLHVNSEILLENNVLFHEKEFMVSYYNMREFGGITGDNFMLEAVLKNSLNEGGITCQLGIIYIMCENGRMGFSIGIPGCSSNLGVITMNKLISGKENDLSMFGCDMENWNKVRFETKDKNVSITLNDKLIFTTEYSEPGGKIIGLHFLFTGSGSVKSVKMYNEKKELKYEDEFKEIAASLN